MTAPWIRWPRTLAARTALVLLLGLAVVQAAGLLIHALDRTELQRLGEGRDIGYRVVGLYRSVVASPPETWPSLVRELDPGPNTRVSIEAVAPREELDPAPADVQRLLRPYLTYGGVPLLLRPRETVVRGGFVDGRLTIGHRLPDDRWLVVRTVLSPPRPWDSATFPIAFFGMTLAAAILTIWATRRLTAPVRTLAEAAERLGRDVNSPPLPEDGPLEVATAALAFNTMAARIRRFVQDRTFLLTAIGHDLRTPITRLKLRAEWMEDDEQRRKMLADLDELEAMVAATLAFGRDDAAHEPLVPVDLAVLLRTVVDEAADARPELSNRTAYAGPDHLTVRLRPMAFKRAVTNLVSNALLYGGSAHVMLAPAELGIVQVTIDDDGPGIAPAELDRVFEPFYRLEASRSRETGGTGLGLPISRNILRAHGGDVELRNRPTGGMRALLTLPA